NHVIDGLRAGDHFDLLRSLAAEGTKNHPPPKPAFVPIGLPPPDGKRVAVDLLVQDGLVVLPVTTRQIPTGPPDPRTKIPPSKTVQEVVIALNAEEVDGVKEALALKATVTCFARSGRPESPGSTS